MCMQSVIYDHYDDKWRKLLDDFQRQPLMPYVPTPPPISPAEVDEFRTLLARAREWDRKNNQPDCGLEEKRKKVKELADSLGIEVGFV